MTPHETAKRKVLAEWLHKAGADLALAEHLLDESAPYPSAIAFHSQQAAEKYLKALLVWRETLFPKTHDLQLLLNLIRPSDAALAESLQETIALTPYGAEMRYPRDRPDPTAEQACEAVALAQKVRRAVCAALLLA